MPPQERAADRISVGSRRRISKIDGKALSERSFTGLPARYELVRNH